MSGILPYAKLATGVDCGLLHDTTPVNVVHYSGMYRHLWNLVLDGSSLSGSAARAILSGIGLMCCAAQNEFALILKSRRWSTEYIIGSRLIE